MMMMIFEAYLTCVYLNIPSTRFMMIMIMMTVFLVAQKALVGQGLLILETSRSHSDTPQSVGLLWTSD